MSDHKAGPWEDRYDPSKDQLVQILGAVPIKHYGGELEVALHRYDEGPLMVELRGVDCWEAPDPQRMSLEEARQLSKLLAQVETDGESKWDQIKHV